MTDQERKTQAEVAYDKAVSEAVAEYAMALKPFKDAFESARDRLLLKCNAAVSAAQMTRYDILQPIFEREQEHYGEH